VLCMVLHNLWIQPSVYLISHMIYRLLTFGKAPYRLLQTAGYWPEGIVFVTVVDPCVESERRSVAVKTSASHCIVTPDNGTLTHVKKYTGIIEARQIDERISMLPSSLESYTFHGRDIYAYMGQSWQLGSLVLKKWGLLFLSIAWYSCQ
jgi:S-adenosylmethionine hydrolase